MTNLFLNDSRMNNKTQIIPGLGTENKSEVLAKVKAVFFQYFEQVVDDCCMRIDLEFGVQLGKKREKIGKEQYIKLLEYLRSVRKEIKQNYLFRVNAIFEAGHYKIANDQRGQFDFSKVSLISDDSVKENHAVTEIIRQCEHLFYDELTSLNHMQLTIQSGKQTIADSQNPIFPEKLVRALVDVVKTLKLNSDGRIALYKVFEANVFSQLGVIYRELIKLRETGNPAQLYVVGEIKEKIELAPVSTEQPSAEFKRLQKKLEQWRLAQFPSAYDSISVSGNVFYEYFEVKHALQVLQQFSDDSDHDEKKQPLKWRVLKKLKELSFSNKVKNMTKDDEDVLDLVALIVSRIKQDELVHDDVKTAILQLEIPLAVASLGRYSIFTRQDNPVRQLLDDLFSAGTFLNADDYDARLMQKRIADTVGKMIKAEGFELAVWTAEAGEFSDFFGKQKKCAQITEESTKQLMISQQALVSSRKTVHLAIENSIKGKALPTAIVGFLRDVWSEVLLDVMDNEEQWKISVQAMDDLIVSMSPPADDNERKQLLKVLPGLIAELRKGLKKISYDKAAQSRFFKELAVWHLILMDKKEKSAKDSVMAVQGDKINLLAVADDSAEWVGNLAVQSWVAFIFESGRQWGKLLWKDAENMLFVGKSGVKIFEIRADELAGKLRLGQTAIVKVNEKTITERVLTELMDL